MQEAVKSGWRCLTYNVTSLFPPPLFLFIENFLGRPTDPLYRKIVLFYDSFIISQEYIYIL